MQNQHKLTKIKRIKGSNKDKTINKNNATHSKQLKNHQPKTKKQQRLKQQARRRK